MSARAKRKPFIAVLSKHPRAFLWGKRGAIYFAKRCTKFGTVTEAQHAIDDLRLSTGLPFVDAYVARLVTPGTDPATLHGTSYAAIIVDDMESA